MKSKAHALALSTEDCWEVLKVAHVGRLLYTVNALPAAQMVRFVVRNRLIIFSLDPVSAARIMRVEFMFGAVQADDVSADHLLCRSVVALGAAGLMPAGAMPLVLTLGLPGHCDEAVYGFVAPMLVDGTTVDLRP
jgi:hypothetical protein